MFATILAAAGMFAATNIDDIVVLTALFLASSKGTPRPWHIVGGQYAGFITLVGLSLLAALGLTIVPDEWVGLLGILPLALGILGLIRGLKKDDDDDENRLTEGLGLVGIAGITIANGADNIAIYTPVFRTMAPSDRHHRHRLPSLGRALVRSGQNHRHPPQSRRNPGKS